MPNKIFESETRNTYSYAMRDLRNNYETLRKIDPNNKHLEFVKFKGHELDSIMPEFWKRYGPEDGKTSNFAPGLHAIIEANRQIKKAMEKLEETAEVKGLIPEFD